MTNDEPRSELLDIAEVVSTTGVPVTTLHVWERKGLIRPSSRVGLRRQYRPDVVDTIATIVLLQEASFTLAEIGDLFTEGAFDDGKQLLTHKLTSLREAQRAIETAIDGLQHAVDCANPNPFACDGFQRHLTEILPRRTSGIDMTKS